MNKNWGDKADKDLFFTLLSVKNVGVITGSEWATVGNTMRMMGYGFTNEGCRQHFQGLRRTQYKDATAANLLPDGRFKHDPAQNPITRRPGPGRGRPRKNAAVKPGTIPIEPLPEGVRIVSTGPRHLMPAPTPGGVAQGQAPVHIQSNDHVIPQHGPPPPGHGTHIHHGLSPPARSAQPPGPAYETPPAVTGPPIAPMTENDDAPGEDEPPSKRPRVDGREKNSTIVDLALAASTQLEEESADDMEDDDEEEELFGGLEAPESSGAGPADKEDKEDTASNHDTEAAVLTLVAAGDGPPAAASNVSSPSWGTPPEAEFSTHSS